MDKQIAAYAGSALAIALGAALLWFPPTQLVGQAATVGSAFSFITTGLIGLGLSATVPAAVRGAHEQGRLTGHREAASRLGPPRP